MTQNEITRIGIVLSRLLTQLSEFVSSTFISITTNTFAVHSSAELNPRRLTSGVMLFHYRTPSMRWNRATHENTNREARMNVFFLVVIIS